MHANSHGTRQSAPLGVVVFKSVNVLTAVDDVSCDVNAPAAVVSDAATTQEA